MIIKGSLSTYNQEIIIITGIVHLVFCTSAILCNNLKYQKIVQIFIKFPIVLNIVLNCINSNCISCTRALSLIFYILTLLILIKPFDQMNHLAVHILLFFMSIALVNQNINV